MCSDDFRAGKKTPLPSSNANPLLIIISDEFVKYKSIKFPREAVFWYYRSLAITCEGENVGATFGGDKDEYEENEISHSETSEL
jgi:hypothetical protein